MKRLCLALTVLLFAATFDTASADPVPRSADRIMFMRGSRHMTVNPDGSDVRPVSPEVSWSADWSPDGRRIVHAKDTPCSSPCSPHPVWVLDLATGKEREIAQFNSPPTGFAWSPDGTRIAYTKGGYSADDPSGPRGLYDYGIWVMDADGRNQRLVTRGTGASWSPGGGRLAFVCDTELCTINVDGTGLQQIPGTLDMRSADWSPDGMSLLSIRVRAFQYDAVIVGLDGTIERVFPGVIGARWSSDGTTLALVRGPRVGGLFGCLPEPCETYPGIWLVDRDGSDLRRITTDNDSAPQYAR